MFQDKLIKSLTKILLTLAIIYLFGKLTFILNLGGKIIGTVLIPILIGLLFYYMLRPAVRFLVKNEFKKNLSVTIVVLFFILTISLLFTYSSNTIITSLSVSLNNISNQIKNMGNPSDIINNKFQIPSINLGDIQQKATSFLQTALVHLSNNVVSIFSNIADIGSKIILVPFVLFYFLKDDDEFTNIFINLFSEKHKNNIKDLLKDTDRVLSDYIAGQLVAALVIGVFMYIGYLIIGMENALFLAIFAIITSIIPFLGPILGILPAFLISLSMGNFPMLLKIIIVSIIVQQIEGNFITPNIMGNRLKIHPLTIIFVIMIAISVFGFIGAFIAVPLYALLKVWFKDIRQMYKESKLVE